MIKSNFQLQKEKERSILDCITSITGKINEATVTGFTPSVFNNRNSQSNTTNANNDPIQQLDLSDYIKAHNERVSALSRNPKSPNFVGPPASGQNQRDTIGNDVLGNPVVNGVQMNSPFNNLPKVPFTPNFSGDAPPNLNLSSGENKKESVARLGYGASVSSTQTPSSATTPSSKQLAQSPFQNSFDKAQSMFGASTTTPSSTTPSSTTPSATTPSATTPASTRQSIYPGNRQEISNQLINTTNNRPGSVENTGAAIVNKQTPIGTPNSSGTPNILSTSKNNQTPMRGDEDQGASETNQMITPNYPDEAQHQDMFAGSGRPADTTRRPESVEAVGSKIVNKQTPAATPAATPTETLPFEAPPDPGQRRLTPYADKAAKTPAATSQGVYASRPSQTDDFKVRSSDTSTSPLAQRAKALTNPSLPPLQPGQSTPFVVKEPFVPQGQAQQRSKPSLPDINDLSPDERYRRTMAAGNFNGNSISAEATMRGLGVDSVKERAAQQTQAEVEDPNYATGFPNNKLPAGYVKRPDGVYNTTTGLRVAGSGHQDPTYIPFSKTPEGIRREELGKYGRAEEDKANAEDFHKDRNEKIERSNQRRSIANRQKQIDTLLKRGAVLSPEQISGKYDLPDLSEYPIAADAIRKREEEDRERQRGNNNESYNPGKYNYLQEAGSGISGVLKPVLDPLGSWAQGAAREAIDFTKVYAPKVGYIALTPPKELAATVTGRLGGLGFSKEGAQDRFNYYRNMLHGVGNLGGGLLAASGVGTKIGGAIDKLNLNSTAVNAGKNLLGALQPDKFIGAAADEAATLTGAALYDPRMAGMNFRSRAIKNTK